MSTPIWDELAQRFAEITADRNEPDDDEEEQ